MTATVRKSGNRLLSKADPLHTRGLEDRRAADGVQTPEANGPAYSGAALAVHGKIGAVFKCLGPVHIGLQQPLLPGASGVAASMESVWP
jgi:hypothetical protein